MNEFEYDETNFIDLSETSNDFESETVEESVFDEELNLVDSEEDTARYEKLIRELTEFEESIEVE